MSTKDYQDPALSGATATSVDHFETACRSPACSIQGATMAEHNPLSTSCQAATRFFKGWADARRGGPDKAFQRIREGYEDNTRLGIKGPRPTRSRANRGRGSLLSSSLPPLPAGRHPRGVASCPRW